MTHKARREKKSVLGDNFRIPW